MLIICSWYVFLRGWGYCFRSASEDTCLEEPEHVVVKKYLSEPFHLLVPLDDNDASELVVWTFGIPR